MVFYNNTTIAGIARGATVASDTQVAVSAWTNDVFFALAPTSGVAAGSLSLNGVASYAGINNTTAQTCCLRRLWDCGLQRWECDETAREYKNDCQGA